MYRRSYLNYISGELNAYYINVIEISLVIMTVNKVIMDYWIFGDCHPLNWVNLGIAILYFLLPNETLNKKLFNVPSDEANLNYNNEKINMNIVIFLFNRLMTHAILLLNIMQKI